MAEHKVVHWELMGPDSEQLAGFYSTLFGWKLEQYPGMESYHVVDAEQTGVGGAVGSGSEQMPTYQTIYIQVQSVDDHLAKVEQGGGKIVTPRTVIPGTVAFGLFNDPAGNLVGLVEEETPPAE